MYKQIYYESLEQKFIQEIKIFVETNKIIDKLNDKIDNIKKNKIDISLISEDFLENFNFKKVIFSDEEKKKLNSFKQGKYSEYIKTFINNGNSLFIVDVLAIYMIYMGERFKEESLDLIMNISESNLNITKAIYLDFNILLHFSDFKEEIDTILKENNGFLVYSDIHTGEISCIPENENKHITISKIKKINKTYINNIQIRDNGLFESDFSKTLEISKRQPILRIARIIKVLEHPKFDYKCYSENDPSNKIIKFIKEEKIDSKYLNNMSLNEIFRKYNFLFKCFCELKENFEEDRIIFVIMLFMDCINYRVDKKIKTFISSFFDELHLEYAIKTGIFITIDKILGNRAIEIFKYLNVKTEVKILQTQ